MRRRNTAEGDALGDIQGLPRGVVAEGNVHGEPQRHGKRVADGTTHRPGVRPDTNFRGQAMVSGKDAFPYAFLSIDQVN